MSDAPARPPGGRLRGASPSGGRLRGRALLPGLVGGALALVTGAQPWWRASAEGVDVAFSGTETTAGLASALGVVALAGWLLVLVLRTRGRQVVGVLLALTGAGVVVAGSLGLRPSDAAVRTSVRQVSLVESYGLVATGWSWGYAAAGVLVLAGGLLVAVTAPRWPQRADRFTRTAAVAAATAAEDDPAAVWRAQDAGLDPTTAPRPAAGPAPDVRSGRPGDTMGGAERPLPPPPPE
ncbi:Trp biosynthesis-associated membrane protein [Microlunatus capsulatus]|uniref:Membrane protein (TIGR02234 family) n=1 Tax=Microlunatus capsulatus TaxID=99117 RepID=A0ABS4Z440_9ACTN|nr:Trp biosynthesis-associated membrane protein [Microlunatus capsulatus]MBP2415560.1 putative membrane protein (TIGR02234 family) [Microlunatus capsulatus]